MRRFFPITLATLAALSLGGCEGCLHLNDYELVTDGGFTSTSTSTSTGAGGSTPGTCTDVDGAVIVLMETGSADEVNVDTTDCVLPSDSRPGIDVLALDPARGDCLARMRVPQDSGVTLTSTLRVRYESDSVAVLAGTYRGGALSLPRRCSDGADVVLAEEAGATDTLFVAQLRVEAGIFCTSWARRAITTDAAAAGALRVTAVEIDAVGRVGVAGSLGGALTQFEGGAFPNSEVRGHAFFAQFSPNGFLDAAAALRAAPGAADAAMGVSAFQSTWLVTGALRAESPACHGCDGPVSVLDAAGICPEGGAGGGGGGAGGAGGAGPDSDNAFLWRPGLSGSCTGLASFGSDRLGNGDAQVGFDVSGSFVLGPCTTYWTGLAGMEAWPLIADDPSSALFGTGGVTRDGFIAWINGGSSFGCTSGNAGAWSVRLVPALTGAVVNGERVEATHCAEGAVATVFAHGNAGGIDMHRCATGSPCEPSIGSLTLAAGEEQQLVMLGLLPDGSLNWHGSIGPVDVDPQAAAGVPAGRSISDLTLDSRDDVYVALRTTGPLRVRNVEPRDCADLKDDAPAGTWALGLRRDGVSGQADCMWAKRLAP